MAEDLSDIIQPMDFHPCDTPRGMLYYDMEILTKQQQTRLNTLKIETVRDNQKYLAAHPEIRACVAIISRLVMRQRPRTNIHETIAEYFAKSKVDIENDVNEYLEQRKNYGQEAVSALNLCRMDESLSESESSERDISRGTLLAFSQMSSHHESEFWRAGLSDITTMGLQMQQSESLRNMGIDFDKIRKSVSSSNRSGSAGSKTKSQKSAAGGKMATHISEYLSPAKANDDDANLNGTSSYGGHIPTIEDYDAGYSKRRRTYISDNEQGFQSDISQFLRDKQSQPSLEEVEIQLEPTQHASDVEVEPKPTAAVPTELSSVGVRDSVEMQSLMERHTSGLSETALHRLDGDFRDMPSKMTRKTSSFSKASHRKSSSKSQLTTDDSTKEKPDRTISFHITKSGSVEKARGSSMTRYTDVTEDDRKESIELKSRLKKSSVH